MELTCTRPGCPRPTNIFPELSQPNRVKTVQQKFCTSCGMPLILVGRYLPQRLLGKGGFGAAYYAVDRFSPALRPCVVKLFQPDGNLTPQQLELAQGLFEREAEALEQLGNDHPQIPDLLAFFPLEVDSLQPGQVQELFYLVQEYIDGQSLEQELAQRGAFSESETLTILEQVLPVLEFVHGRNSIHRDIKPSNIMRDRSGKIYLLDFGAVKQVTQSAGAGGAKAGSTGIYSMGYAPPEQMQGGRVYPATDLYALAVTALVLLTNAEPEALFDSYSGRWNYRSRCQISDRFGVVLDRMLQSTPSDRFGSATIAIKALGLVRPPRNPPSGTAPPGAAASATSHQPPPLPQQPPPLPNPSPRPQAQGNLLPTVTGLQGQAPVQQAAPPASSAAQANPKIVQPSPGPIQSQPAAGQASRPAKPPAPPLSLARLLGNALFTGAEGSLLAIAALSLLGTTLIGPGVWLLLLGVLISLQWFRVLEGADLWIILSLTLLLLAFLPPLTSLVQGSWITMAIAALAGGLISLAVTLLFQLIYRLLRRLL